MGRAASANAFEHLVSHTLQAQGHRALPRHDPHRVPGVYDTTFLNADAEYRDAVRGIDLAELCITSSADMAEGPAPDEAFRLADVPGVAVVIGPADGQKCERCWRVLPEVGQSSEHSEVCGRCADAVAHHRAAAE